MVEDEVRAFVQSNFYLSEYQLEPNDSLFALGVLDWAGVQELVAFIEGTYGFHVDDREAVPENLDSVAAMARFIRRKRPELARAG